MAKAKWISLSWKKYLFILPLQYNFMLGYRVKEKNVAINCQVLTAKKKIKKSKVEPQYR